MLGAILAYRDNISIKIPELINILSVYADRQPLGRVFSVLYMHLEKHPSPSLLYTTLCVHHGPHKTDLWISFGSTWLRQSSCEMVRCELRTAALLLSAIFGVGSVTRSLTAAPPTSATVK